MIFMVSNLPPKWFPHTPAYIALITYSASSFRMYFNNGIEKPGLYSFLSTMVKQVALLLTYYFLRGGNIPYLQILSYIIYPSWRASPDLYGLFPYVAGVSTAWRLIS